MAQTLADDEIPALDAGFKIRELQQLPRYLVRLAVNFTGRRNVLPSYTRGRPPEYGALVRPLPRKYKDKIIRATPPDRVETWTEKGILGHRRTRQAIPT